MTVKAVYADNMRKQMERDRKVLLHLSGGIATMDSIWKACFMHNGRALSRQCIERRLSVLIREGYIERRRYRGIHPARGKYIFSLAQRGVDAVCNYFNQEMDHLRTGLPSQACLVHELQLSEIYRTLLREHQIGKVRLFYLYDDKNMKRLARHHRGAKFYMPDLRLEFAGREGRRLAVNIELDTGNKGKGYWLAKIGSWSDLTLMITLNRPRLERLKHYAQGLTRENPVGFAVACDFLQGGLRDTVWDWVPQMTRARLEF